MSHIQVDEKLYFLPFNGIHRQFIYSRGKPGLIIFDISRGSGWKSESHEGTQNLTRVQRISRGYTESDECSTFLTFPEFAISPLTLCESKRNLTRGKSSIILVIFPVKMHLTAGSQESDEGQFIFKTCELPKGAHRTKVSGIPQGEYYL